MPISSWVISAIVQITTSTRSCAYMLDVIETPEVEADPDYYTLSNPLVLLTRPGEPERTLDKLLINSSKLSGKQYFQICSRFQQLYPEEARSSINKFSNDNFLSLI